METKATHFKRFGMEPENIATGYIKINGGYVPCGYVEIQTIDYKYVSKDGLIQI